MRTYGLGVQEACVARQLGKVGLLPLLKASVDFLHVLVAMALQHAPVELDVHREAKARGQLAAADKHLPQMGGLEHELFRHASDVDAGAAVTRADALAIHIRDAAVNQTHFLAVTQRAIRAG